MRITRRSRTRKRTARKTRAEKRAAKIKEIAKSAIAANSEESLTALEARLLEPIAEVEKMLAQLLDRSWFQPIGWEWPDLPSLFATRMPSVDVIDRPKEIIVTAEIPGIDKEDVHVSVTDRTLTIKGESRHEKETDEGDMHRREIRRGSFYRTLTLPFEVDGGKAKAKCKDGMVELHLPKMRSAGKHSLKLS